MEETLTKQELHNLAMNIVGKDLEAQGFEFLGVNSKLKRISFFLGAYFNVVNPKTAFTQDINFKFKPLITLLQ